MVGVLEDHVDHPGNRVRAVTRGGAVAQHFDMVDRRQRDRIQIRRRRAAAHRPAQVDEGAGMAALAIDQHQHLIRRQPTQLRRAHQFGAVHQARTREVDRRNQPRQHRPQLIGTGAAQGVAGNHIDRRQRRTGRALLGAGAGDDHGVELGCIGGGRFGREDRIETHGGQQIGRQNRRVQRVLLVAPHTAPLESKTRTSCSEFIRSIRLAGGGGQLLVVVIESVVRCDIA